MTDRGISTPLGYVFTLAVATALITGLLVAGGGFVSDTRQQVIRQELHVIGQHLASNVEMADRMVQAGGDVDAVALNQSFTQRVTGSNYRVDLVPGADPFVRLNSTSPDVSVEIDLENETALGESSADGGDISVVYDSANEELVIQNG